MFDAIHDDNRADQKIGKSRLEKKQSLVNSPHFRYYLIGLSSGSRGTGQGELQTGITRFYLQDTKMLQISCIQQL